MVAYQEELDWTIYAAYALVLETELVPLDEIQPIASEHRPFAIRLARRVASGARSLWFDAMEVSPSEHVPSEYSELTKQVIQRRINASELSQDLLNIEAPEYKRKWEPLNRIARPVDHRKRAT